MKKFFLIASLSAGTLLFADSIDLQNGDRYNGKVLSLDQSQVRFESEVNGVMAIPRERIKTIHLGGTPQAPTLSAIPVPAPQKTNGIAIDPQTLAQVQRDLLGTASPEASQMFSQMVQGLSDGTLKIGDLQKQAAESLAQLRELQKEIGDDDENPLLNQYATILENFIKRAGTNQTVISTNPPPAPAAP
ncbi:MAG: hypothetical protein SFY81_06015 [Verrucomicrobiota bacterium]|nr:hypothetical protein [Verrucomicrobiota bacterium]